MQKLIKRDRGNYTNISNIVVRDSRLSWKARGIFLYLWSQANEWQFYVSEVATHATDGESALRSGLKELEHYGYLERNHRHNDSGSFDGMDWILTDKPEQDFDHYAENRNDAKIKEKPPKKSENRNDAKIKEKVEKMGENASDGKRIRWKTHPMENRSLRNNNNKNYQDKELTTNKSSSVFSTYVEVILDSAVLDVGNSCFLHVCGGDPYDETKKRTIKEFSPRMWR